MSITSSIQALTDADRLTLFALMAQTRAFQETLLLNRRKIPGPLLVAMGQEAVSAGSFLALHKAGILESSIKAPDHRIMFGAAIAMDVLSPKEPLLSRDLMRNFLVRAAGGNRGRDGNQHWGALSRRIMPFMCSDMSVNAMIAVGYAEELRRREWSGLPEGERPVGVVFFGDGAAQQGIVHEGMNWVAASNFRRTPHELMLLRGKWLDEVTRELSVVRGAPVIFIINNNSRACFTDPGDSYGASDLARRAQGYAHMIGVDVDGTDPEAMYRETAEAIVRAQHLESTLIVAHNYRLSGHNADQTIYKEGALERRDFFDVERIFGLSDVAEFHEAVTRDPVTGLWSSTLRERKVASREKLDDILASERAQMDALFADVLSEPKITVSKDAEDRSVFPSFPPAHEPEEGAPTERMGYNKAFAWILGKLLREDARTVYFGEDIANSEGGVLALTKGVFSEFGPARVFNAAISEEMIVASAAGRALAGGKPLFEFQFGSFWWDAARIFAHAIAPNWFLKKMEYGLIAIAPCGVVHGGGSGHFHEDWPERFLAPMRGIVVVAPADAYEVVGLMRAAHEFKGPVVVLLQSAAASLPDFFSLVPETSYSIPLGEAHVAHEGADVTVVTYGAACVAAAKNEAGVLAKEGISLEVVNLRTVYPWDTKTIIASVQKTGRCVIFHEDCGRDGIGEQLAGALSGDVKFLSYVKTPHIPVVGASTPFSVTDLDLAWERFPYEREKTEHGVRHRSSKLAAAVRGLIHFS